MSQLVQRIRIAQKLPDNLEEREAVINRAMDIRSSCFLYLAAHLPHDVVPLGDIGKVDILATANLSVKVFKTFVIGDEKLTDASVLLERTVARYDTAVNDAHMALTLYAVQVVEGYPSCESFLISRNCRLGEGRISWNTSSDRKQLHHSISAKPEVYRTPQASAKLKRAA